MGYPVNRIILTTSVILFSCYKKRTKTSSKIGFYIDNSFGMERKDDNNTMLIDYAKNNAKYFKKIRNKSKNIILTNDFNKNIKWYYLNKLLI